MPGRSPRNDRPRHDAGHLRQRRQRVATEAARLLATRASPDLDDARRRAMRMLGEDGRDALPDADLVRDELRAYLRLFHGDAQAAALRALRLAALDAMAFLAAFQPRLVGPVLAGTADAGAPVQLQLFSDDPDALPRFLEDHGIPARSIERRLRLPGGASTRLPAWTVEADGVVVELLPLPIELLHQALPGDDPGTVLHRANAAAVRALLETETGPGSTSRTG
jgi:hypothetical protein